MKNIREKLVALADKLDKKQLFAAASRIDGILAYAAMDEFTKNYIEAALWSSTDEEGIPLDRNHSVHDLAPETLEKMEKDCAEFQKAHHDDIKEDLGQAGYDFWMTRNRHGVGFWETDDWPEEAGKRLTDAAHKYGECDLYFGDDGKIYLSR